MDAIRDKHNFVELDAHGLAVGLKEGLMGNSEVGYVLQFHIITRHSLTAADTLTSVLAELSGRTLSRLTSVSWTVR